VSFSAGIVAHTGAVELDITTATVTDGDIELIDASVVSIEVLGASVFVGSGGALLDQDLPGEHDYGLDIDAINNNGVGFLSDGINFAMVLARGSEGDHAGNTYLGITAGIDDARLLGVDGLELWATGTAKLNKATDADGTELAQRMDWASATDDETNDTTRVLADLDISSAVKLQASGSGSLNIGSGAVVAGITDFSLNIATMTVETGNTNLGSSGVLTDADVVSVNVMDASLFVGTGHAGLHATTHEPLPRGAAAIGFDVTDVGFALVSVTDTQGTGASYTGVSASVTDAALVGISGVELYVSGLVKLNQAPTVQRVDWSVATGFDTDPVNNDPDDLLANLDISSAVQLQASGSAAISIANGSFVATTGLLALNIATADVSDGTTSLTAATILSLDISGAAIFAGINGPSLAGSSSLPVDGDDNLIVPGDAIGFLVTGASLKLAMVTDTDGNEYLGLEAGITSASLTGFDTDAVTLELSGRVLVNQATDSTGLALAQRMSWVDADAAPETSLLPAFTTTGGTGEPLLNDDIQFLVWGAVTANLFDTVTLGGQFTFMSSTSP
jgi:hypothetical protein